MAELKPLRNCPFCGGEAIVFTYRNERERTNPTVVKCKECGVKTAIYADIAWRSKRGIGGYLMADELISRQAAIKLLRGKCVGKYPSTFMTGLFAAADEIDKLPAVDAVEVVRCKDCRWGVESDFYKSYKCTIDAEYDENVGEYIGFVEWHRADFYCAYGDRRAEDAI